MEEEYEDDFEDYDDDDFEEDIEDSGNDSDDEQYATTRQVSAVDDKKSVYQRAKMEQELNDVKKAMISETSARPNRRPARQEEDIQTEVERETKAKPQKRPPSGKGYVNFSAAKERHKTQVAAGKVAKRGDRLLQMIRLDVVNFDLFELPPIRYEAFMKTFGASNTLQATTQTGEDNIDEEAQTEAIETLDKWTQKPPATIAALDLEDQDLLSQYIKGVGGETKSKPEDNSDFINYANSLRLTSFLDMAGSAMITLLEEESQQRHDAQEDGQEEREVEFSDRVIMLNTDLPFLQDCAIHNLAFASDQAGLLLSTHKSRMDEDSETDSRSSSTAVIQRTILCLWNVSHPSMPQKILAANGLVTACTFSPFKASAALAGMENGTICVWDLRESSTIHQEVTREVYEEIMFVFRSPTYTTNVGEESHNSSITAICCLPDSKDESIQTDLTGGGTFQIVTSEVRGIVLIWTVLDSQRDFEQNLGLAHWGTMRLVQTMMLDLTQVSNKEIGVPEVSVFDVACNPKDGSQLFIAVDDGTVMHASIHPGHRPNPRSYKPEYETMSASKSIAFCPFDEPYLLVGSDDGTIRLHAITNERPLISWPGTIDGQAIDKVVWSQSRPCVFVVLDTSSRIHLWDLGAGDIYPAHTIEFNDLVTCIAMNTELWDGGRQRQLLALGLDNGSIEVHHLRDEYRSLDKTNCQKELAKFMHYVSII